MRKQIANNYHQFIAAAIAAVENNKKYALK